MTGARPTITYSKSDKKKVTKAPGWCLSVK